MKIYFAGSIRGGGSDAKLYKKIIEYLREYGEVIGGEHADNKILSALDNKEADDRYIYNRDSRRLNNADVLVAEVTTPSLGVGYEIGISIEQNKKILCLFRQKSGKKLSAMIHGCPKITNLTYSTLKEAKKAIDAFFNSI
jgi:nucleoside 2-deoxyribosyltransferase